MTSHSNDARNEYLIRSLSPATDPVGKATRGWGLGGGGGGGGGVNESDIHL